MKYSIVIFLVFIKILSAGKISVQYDGSDDSRLLKKAINSNTFRLQFTNGDIQNLRNLLKDKDTKLAVVQDDILRDIVEKKPSLRNKLEIVAPLYKAAVMIIVNKNSDITSFKDLSNRVVAVDVMGSGDLYTFLKLQEKYLVTPEIYNIKKNDILKYLDDGTVNAVFYIGNIKNLQDIKKYKIVKVDEGFKSDSFKIDGNTTMLLPYMDKFLVTTRSKFSTIKKDKIYNLLSNIIAISSKKELCSYNLDSFAVASSKYFYIVCSQSSNIKKIKSTLSKKTKISHRAQHGISVNYFSNLNNILVYPDALKNHNFRNDITSYTIEKIKINNAIKIIKDNLKKQHSKRRVVVISKGRGAEAIDNANYIYKKLKSKGVSRGQIVKKAINIQCDKECFEKTTIQFRLI